MFRDLWDRLTRGRRARLAERETERERASPAERHRMGESVEDIQADGFVGEHLGGISPDRLSREDAPPRDI